MPDLKLTLIISLTVALLTGTAGWVANGWRLNAKIDRMIAEHAIAAAEANKQALAQYAEMERKKQEAIDEANRVAKQNADAAATARADADRLRRQLASANGVSTATVASLRKYTSTLQTVFGECVSEVERLAAAADGYALDTRTLIGAWPK